MARRLGIELSASRCALVDVDERGSARRQAPVRVRTFRTIPWSVHTADPFVATLRLLRKSGIVPRRAVVALWDLGATCHHFSLPSGDGRRLRVQALRELSAIAPAQTRGSAHAVLVDDVAAHAGRMTRDVTVVAAPAAQVRVRLAPLIAADFAIEAVITPAMALASLDRLLRAKQDEDARAYVAVNAEATAVAIVRNGLPIAAREFALPIRCAAGGEEPGGSPDALDFARCLAPELKRIFLLLKQQSQVDVRHLVVCGEFPELRALTAPLATSLQLEVATLDGVQGLAAGAGAVLDPEVRDHAGELRVAWAAGATGSPLTSLLPADTAAAQAGRHSVRRLLPRAAAVLVVLAALVVVGGAVWSRGGATRPQRRAPIQAPSHPGAHVDAAVNRAAARDAAVPSVRSGDTSVRRPRTRQPAEAKPVAPGAPDAAADPVIDSILYGPERRLALIEHRVVRIGDPVSAGVVADIEPHAVVIRRPSGELRRIEMRTK